MSTIPANADATKRLVIINAGAVLRSHTIQSLQNPLFDGGAGALIID
jgi:hypothetical protein